MTDFKFNDPNEYRLAQKITPAIEIDPDYLELMKYIKDNSKELKQMLSSMLAHHKDKVEVALEYEKIHRTLNPNLY